MTRATADAPPPVRSESVTIYKYPISSTLRKCRPWHALPTVSPGTALDRLAHHEAGHVIVMRWMGLPSPGAFINAEGPVMRGEAAWPARSFWAAIPDPPADETGALAATCAAVYHAGVMAEFLQAGVRWAGPVHYPAATDYQRADDMLRPSFGSHASGAHAFAQQLALHVLCSLWGDVVEIADQLKATSQWRPAAQTQEKGKLKRRGGAIAASGTVV